MTAGFRWVLVPALWAAPLAAQARFSLETSGGATRHQYTDAGTAFSLTPRLRWTSGPALVDAGFTYTRGAAMRWNAEGGARASVGAGLGDRAGLSVAAEGWWTRHRIGQGTGQWALVSGLRLDRVAGAELAFEAGGGYASTTSGPRWFSVAAARSTWRLGPVELGGLLRHTRFTRGARRWGSSWTPVLNASDTMPPVPDTLGALRHYSDFGATVAWSDGRTRLVLQIEQRFGHREFRSTAWHLEGTRFVAPSLAVFASAGQTLSALTAGLPARRYTTLGVRWAPGPVPLIVRSGARSRPMVRFERGPAGGSLVAIRAGDAGVAEVMGDFTDWQPLMLIPEGGGWWRLPAPLRPGLYRFNLRTDGGLWRTPPGLPSEPDDFGSRIAVLVVPGG